MRYSRNKLPSKFGTGRDQATQAGAWRSAAPASPQQSCPEPQSANTSSAARPWIAFDKPVTPKRLFLSGTHREAIAALNRGLAEGHGFLAITGEAGLGKTALLNAVLAGRTGTASLASPVHELHGDPRQRLRSLIGTPDAPAAWGGACPPSGSILVIDDAHKLDLTLLQELSTDVRLNTLNTLLSRIVFAGRPEFWSALNDPSLSDLRDRILVRTVLFPMPYAEAEAYVEHLFRLADSSTRAVLPGGALHALLQRARGNPRRINAELEAKLATIGEGYSSQLARRIGEGTVRLPGDLPGDADVWQQWQKPAQRRDGWTAAALAVALVGIAAFLMEPDRAPGPRIAATGVTERADRASRLDAPVGIQDDLGGSLEEAPVGQPPSAAAGVLPDTMVAALLRRGDAMLELGDIPAARRFYKRAAKFGSAEAAAAMGATYDPARPCCMDPPGGAGSRADIGGSFLP